MTPSLSNICLKIISDISCDVYVNNEKATSLSRYEMKEISLPIGDYLVQLISDKNPKYRIIKRVSLNKEELLYVEFAKELKSHPEWIDYSDLDHYREYHHNSDNQEGYGILNKVLNIKLIPAIYNIVNLDEWDLYETQDDIYRFYNQGKFVAKEEFEAQLLETRRIDGYFLKNLMCVGKKDKYGFINYYGEEVIPFIYDSAGDFWGDLARVKKGDKWGFIDTFGNLIVDFIYDSAANFHDGLARVVRNNRYGFIDASGKEIIPCLYKYAYDFKDNSAVVQSDKYGVINTKGDFIYPMEIEELVLETNWDIIGRKGKFYGIVGRDGREVMPFTHSYSDILPAMDY